MWPKGFYWPIFSCSQDWSSHYNPHNACLNVMNVNLYIHILLLDFPLCYPEAVLFMFFRFWETMVKSLIRVLTLTDLKQLKCLSNKCPKEWKFTWLRVTGSLTTEKRKVVITFLSFSLHDKFLYDTAASCLS